MIKEITQHQAIFYFFYKKYIENKNELTPLWRVVGEHYINEFDQWVLISYEVSARMSELYKNNPELFYREWQTGKSGSRYYAYKIAENPNLEKIKQEEIREFYLLLKRVL